MLIELLIIPDSLGGSDRDKLNDRGSLLRSGGGVLIDDGCVPFWWPIEWGLQRWEFDCGGRELTFYNSHWDTPHLTL